MKYFLVLFIFSFVGLNASAQAEQPLPLPNESCKISGRVIAQEQFLMSPYGHAPSTFSDVFIRVTVDIQSIDTHEKYNHHDQPPKQGFCNTLKENKSHSFKLCTPHTPRTGERIQGIIAPPTGASSYGCIFDVRPME